MAAVLTPPVFGPETSLPADGEIEALWEQHAMPPHIREHSRVVRSVALQLVDWLAESGVVLSRSAVEAGALLHDIAKAPTLESGMPHDREAERILTEHGYPELGYVAGVHVTLPEPHPLDEATVVYYADKRVQHTALVSLDDRFVDLVARYGQGDPVRIAYLEAIHERSARAERALFAATEGRLP